MQPDERLIKQGFHPEDEVDVTPYGFDLMGGYKLMKEGVTAEMLDSLTGDVVAPLSDEEAAKVARQRMLSSLIEDRKQPKSRRERAARGFANRSEERKARRSLVAQIRRYHRLACGPRTEELKARALKRRKAANKFARALEALETQNV